MRTCVYVNYIFRYISRTALYEMYTNEWTMKKLRLSELPSRSSFMNVLDKYHNNVHFLRKTVLGRCDFCMSIPTRKAEITNDHDLATFHEAIQQH